MDEILINTGVYGILAMALLNLIVIVVAYQKRALTISDCLWLVLAVIGVSLIAAAVFTRSIMNMSWLYYAAILASLIGMISLFLNLSRRLVRKP